MTHSGHALRPAWLLIRLRLRRVLNQMGSVLRSRMGSPDRKAAGGTAPIGWLLSVLVGLAMLWSFGSIAQRTIANIESTLGSVRVEGAGPARGSADRATASEKRGSTRRRLPTRT